MITEEMVERKAMDEVSNFFTRVTDLMEKDSNGVQIGCYSMALLSLAVAIRKVRPFSKFKNPKDIPNHFIRERRELTGVVKRIEPSGALLMVQHKPLVGIPLVSSGQLPVKINGVNVSGLGLSWLQAIVAGKNIKFVPILKEKDYVQCEVMLVEHSKNKESLLNIGEKLVKIGFGTTEPIRPPLSEDAKVLIYFKKLQAAEVYALRKKLGLKYYVKPTVNALENLMNQLINLSKYAAQTSVKQVKAISRMSTA